MKKEERVQDEFDFLIISPVIFIPMKQVTKTGLKYHF
jgi:hypothetical protein